MANYDINTRFSDALRKLIDTAEQDAVVRIAPDIPSRVGDMTVACFEVFPGMFFAAYQLSRKSRAHIQTPYDPSATVTLMLRGDVLVRYRIDADDQHIHRQGSAHVVFADKGAAPYVDIIATSANVEYIKIFGSPETMRKMGFSDRLSDAAPQRDLVTDVEQISISKDFPCAQGILRLASRLFEKVMESDVVGAGLRGQAIELIGLLVQVFGASENLDVPQPQPWRRLVHTIEQGAFEPISVDRIAEEVGCSVSTLTAHSRQYLGKPPYAFSRERRLEEARRLLLEEREMSIAAIAERMGFKWASSLTRAFRSVYGVTPRELRQGARDDTVA